MNILKVGMKVVAPVSVEEYLTPGKVYEIFSVANNKTSFGILSDSGYELYCRFKNCAHLRDGDWKIVQD